MKNFTLTLYAKRKSDGTYDYSLKVWENRSTGTLATTIDFESPAVITQQLDAVLPVGGDGSLLGSTMENTGEYWYPFTMPMSEEQAANLGWRSEGPVDYSQLN
jgi:hypothetical protein